MADTREAPEITGPSAPTPPKTSAWAVASFVSILTAVAIPLLAISPAIAPTFLESPKMIGVTTWLVRIALVAALVLAIVALVQISRNRGRQKGTWMAVIGLAGLPLVYYLLDLMIWLTQRWSNTQ
jgi:Na+/melibiose symporter-like transporter